MHIAYMKAYNWTSSSHYRFHLTSRWWRLLSQGTTSKFALDSLVLHKTCLLKTPLAFMYLFNLPLLYMQFKGYFTFFNNSKSSSQYYNVGFCENVCDNVVQFVPSTQSSDSTWAKLIIYHKSFFFNFNTLSI